MHRLKQGHTLEGCYVPVVVIYLFVGTTRAKYFIYSRRQHHAGHRTSFVIRTGAKEQSLSHLYDCFFVFIFLFATMLIL